MEYITQILCAVISVAGSIIGVFLGWKLNEKSHAAHEAPHLVFDIRKSNYVEDNSQSIEPMSGYKLEIYNAGVKPFFLTSVKLQLSGAADMDIKCDDPESLIYPYHVFTHKLTDEKWNDIKNAWNKKKPDDCKVIASNNDYTQTEGRLDLSAVINDAHRVHGND